MAQLFTQSKAPSIVTAETDTSDLSRRSFLVRTLCAGGVLAAGVALKPIEAQAEILDFLSKLFDLNPVVLNFAHEMEELQASFFERASASRAFNMLEPKQQNVIYGIAAQDRAHFEALDEITRLHASRNGGASRTQHSSVTRRPKMFQFGDAFSSREKLLSSAVELKECCVSAYHGAVHLAGTDLLPPAAAIAGVDGRHLAVLREISGLDPVPFSFENQVSANIIGNKLTRYGFRGGETQEG